ncbi:MAG: hypothetical protein R3F39_05850 [Myxococcota bacterium]
MLAGVGLAVVVGVSSAASAGTPGSGVVGAEARVRAALSGVLTRRELDRVLARPGMARVLDELTRGMDGSEDTLSAVRGPRGVTLKVVLASHERVCLDLVGGAEAPAPAAGCMEQTRVEEERSLELQASLWRPPPRRRASADSPVPQAQPDTAATPEPPLPTVLRRDLAAEALDARGGLAPALVAMLARHDAQVDGFAREAAFRDPIRQAEPDPAVLSAPAAPRERVAGGRIMEALADPYGPGRLRSDLPTPELGPRWAREGGVSVGPGLALLTDDCVREVERGADSDSPPRLRCYRAVTQHGLLERRGIAKVVRPLAMLAKLIPIVPVAPILEATLRGEEKLARDYRVGAMIWVFSWLDWAQQRPGRRAEATAALDASERSVLRTRLWRLWRHRDIPRYASLVTELYEEHLIALYPSIAGTDGLPRRDRSPTAWLWAVNWLTAVAHRPSSEWARLVAALTPEERGLLTTAVDHPRLASVAGPVRGVRAPN